MPIKRRVAKRRIDPAAELEIWESVLASGWDFFRELPDIGYSIDEHGRPARTDAESAWLRFGPQIVAEWKSSDRRPWAETEFGMKGFTDDGE